MCQCVGAPAAAASVVGNAGKSKKTLILRHVEAIKLGSWYARIQLLRHFSPVLQGGAFPDNKQHSRITDRQTLGV